MSNLTGTDKSVILLMTIGEDRAAEVFKHLSQREVQTLSAAMANVTQISNKQLTDVLAEFEQEAEQFAALNINANDYLRSVLVKALGEERAASLLEDILETRDTASGIETLNFMEPQSAADLIRDEHPQIIATILVHLKRAQAADILALFDAVTGAGQGPPQGHQKNGRCCTPPTARFTPRQHLCRHCKGKQDIPLIPGKAGQIICELGNNPPSPQPVNGRLPDIRMTGQIQPPHQGKQRKGSSPGQKHPFLLQLEYQIDVVQYHQHQCHRFDDIPLSG